MYEELILKLRDTGIILNCYPEECNHCESKPYCTRVYANQAADVMEDLIKRETPMKITEIHVDEYYCPACGAENNCDQGCVKDAYCSACGQRLLQEPPKEE